MKPLLSLTSDGTYSLCLHPSCEPFLPAAMGILCCDRDGLSVTFAEDARPVTEDELLSACRSLKRQMITAAAELLGCSEANLLFERQGIRLLWTGQVVTPFMAAHALNG